MVNGLFTNIRIIFKGVNTKNMLKSPDEDDANMNMTMDILKGILGSLDISHIVITASLIGAKIGLFSEKQVYTYMKSIIFWDMTPCSP
jgi:hypothetical protein